MLTPENLHMLRHHPDPEIADTEAQQTILYLLDHINELGAKISGLEYRIEHPPLAENQDDLARIAYEAYMGYTSADALAERPWDATDEWESYGWRLAANAVRVAVEGEGVEIRRRLDAVVAMLEPLEVGVCPDCGGSGDFFVNALPPKGIVPTGSGYKIACETCDGHEDRRGSGVITFPDTSLHARAVAIAEGRDNG